MYYVKLIANTLCRVPGLQVGQRRIVIINKELMQKIVKIYTYYICQYYHILQYRCVLLCSVQFCAGSGLCSSPACGT